MTADSKPTPAVNGELVNRVQALRLGNQLGAKGSSRGGAGWLPWALCGVMALSWAGVGIRGYRNGTFAAPAATTTTATGTTSTTTSATPGTTAAPASIQLELTGYLFAAQTIAVSPIDVGGRVVKLYPGKGDKPFQEGTQYTAGAVIAKLEDTAYLAQVDEAKASLDAAAKRLDAARMKLAGMLPDAVRKIELTQVEEELKEAEATRGRAKDQFGRLEKLGPGVSEQELRQARFDAEGAEARVRRLTATLAILQDGPRKEQKLSAEADVKTAEAEVMGAKARLVQAQWRLENCIIKAPIDGTVLTKKAELGNLVNPMAFSASTTGGGAVCDLADLANLEAEVKVSERDFGKIKAGQKCRVRSKSFPDRVYPGVLDRIMPIANQADNTVSVRVKVELPAGEVPGTYLKPNMGADVSFLAEEPAKPSS